MGATVTMGKLAAAFKGNSGKIFYAIFEKTYEKNCYPHTPEWSCHGFGDLDAILKNVFLGASSCESGMLQSTRGAIKPENYIAAWLSELESPVILEDRVIELKLGVSLYSTVPIEQKEWAMSVLIEHGFSERADALGSGASTSFSLYGEADVLAALFDGFHLGAWRFLNMPRSEHRQPEFGYRPTKAKPESFTPPQFLYSGDDEYFVRQENGGWKVEGWAYSIVGSFIANFWKKEKDHPGSYKAHIGLFRTELQNAPLMPLGAVVVFDDRIEIEDHQRERVEKVRELGIPRENGFEIIVTEEIQSNKDTMYWLRRLPASTWFIPNTQKPGKKQISELDQMDMFA